MKTKYILHGGYANRQNEDNDKFFKEILLVNKKKLNILIVLFAKEPNEYTKKKKVIVNQFNRNNTDKKLSFVVATENSFIKQVADANIIYIHGGQTLRLLNALRKYDEQYSLHKIFSGKTVAGESVGAYVLSKWFYSKAKGGCFAGLSLVDVKTICHYIGKNKEKLEERSGTSKILLLPEHKYKVFEI